MISSLTLKNLIDVLSSPVLVFSEQGICIYCNAEAGRQFNRQMDDVLGRDVGFFFSEAACNLLKNHDDEGNDGVSPFRCRLELSAPIEGRQEVEVELSWLQSAEEGRMLVVVVHEDDALLAQFRQLEEKYEKLKMIVDASATPIWGMEFPEPVDLNVSGREIVRQIFQNESYWSMCNKAMAKLYNLPDDMDFNNQPVRLYFPRSPENESFMQEVLDNDFSVDNALSVDVSHDGSTMYVANSVRAHIENNKLHRMWGEARDVTREKRDFNELVQKERELNDILSAVGDVIFVLDEKGNLQAANPAFEETLGWSIGDLMGRNITSMLKFPDHSVSRNKVKPGEHIRLRINAVITEKGSKDFELTLSCFSDDSNRRLFVGVMRECIETPPSGNAN